ncbi:hypothetical protein ACKFKF_18905 [Phormidesmis sp. 146-12]
MSGSAIEDLGKIPQIPIKDFPTIPFTVDLQQQFAAAGAPLPTDFKVGDQISPDDLFKVGNFEMLGLPDASLHQLSTLTQVNLSSLGVEKMSGFFSSITPENLLQSAGLNAGAMKLSEAPLLKELALQTIFDKLKQGKLSDLAALDNLLDRDRVSGSLQSIVQGLLNGILKGENGAAPELSSIFQGGLPNLSTLPEGLKLPDALPQELPELGQFFGDLKVEEITKALPDFGQSAVNAISPERLSQIKVVESIPGLDQIEIGQIQNIENLSLSSFGDLKVSQLSLGQMPKPLSLLPGIQTGIADISLGTPSAGDREQERIRIVSGGITSKDMVQNGARCEGNSCPHFEIATPGNAEFHGAAWMDAKGQRAPDGFGILCKPWSCKGPPGNHPFGSAARVLLSNINQSTGTADVSLSFAFCRRIPFAGRSCTPWVFPTSSGIPIGKVHEKSLLPFVPPGRYVTGEVSGGFVPPLEVLEPAEALQRPSPTKPVVDGSVFY